MIEFSGMDIIVQHRVADDRVRRALAEALHVPEERVALIDDSCHCPKARESDVVCVCSLVEGEFTYLLSIQIEWVILPYDNNVQLMQRLCEVLGVQYLAPDDDDVDPYMMWLVSPEVVPSKVGLDPVAFDEDRYVISRRV